MAPPGGDCRLLQRWRAEDWSCGMQRRKGNRVMSAALASIRGQAACAWAHGCYRRSTMPRSLVLAVVTAGWFAPAATVDSSPDATALASGADVASLGDRRSGLASRDGSAGSARAGNSDFGAADGDKPHRRSSRHHNRGLNCSQHRNRNTRRNMPRCQRNWPKKQRRGRRLQPLKWIS